jgi:hypothetical protein
MGNYKKLTTAERKARVIVRREARELAKVPATPVGRPRLTIDNVSLAELAEMQCDNKQICAALRISMTTFRMRMLEDEEFREAVEGGRERGKANLRLLQWKHAEGEGGPAVNMTIHMSKHALGEFDKPVNTHSTLDINVEIGSAGDRVAAKLDELRRRMLAAPLPELEVISSVPERVEGGVVEYEVVDGAGGVLLDAHPAGDRAP